MSLRKISPKRPVREYEHIEPTVRVESAAQPTMTSTEIKQEFIRQAKEVWRGSDKLIDQITVDVVIYDRRTRMGVVMSGRPKAINDILLRVPSHVRIEVDRKTLSMPKETIVGCIKHETIHLGYPRHDEDFRRVAAQHNIPISVNQMEGKGFRVQTKLGSRKYETVSTHETLDEAKAAGHKLAEELRKDGRPWRLRIYY